MTGFATHPCHTGAALFREERGLALFFIIALCLGLVTVVLLFAQSVSLEHRAAGAALSGLQAEQSIEGARRYLAFILGNLETPGYMPDLDSGEYVCEAVTVGDARFWLIGRDADETDPSRPYFSLVDEASKLNINTATTEMLEQLPDMTPELAAAIVDWRDTDSDVSPNGAESASYLLLDPPYRCKDGDFESVDELRLILGMELEDLYGEDLNLNHVLDPNEDDGDASPPDDNGDGRLDPGLFEYVTVYSAEPNTGGDNPRVNINSPQRDQLRSVLEEALPSRAAQVLQAVESHAGPFRSILEFYAASGLEASEFALIEDRLTTSDDDTLRGLVNVNTAPAEVLACVPGIGTALAEQLVSVRQSKTADERQSIAWVSEVLDEAAAAEAGPYLTTRSYQFTADIAAVGRHGRGFRRVQYVFDCSSGEVSVVARRNLQRNGWPLENDGRAPEQEDGRL